MAISGKPSSFTSFFLLWAFCCFIPVAFSDLDVLQDHDRIIRRSGRRLFFSVPATDHNISQALESTGGSEFVTFVSQPTSASLTYIRAGVVSSSSADVSTSVNNRSYSPLTNKYSISKSYQATTRSQLPSTNNDEDCSVSINHTAALVSNQTNSASSFQPSSSAASILYSFAGVSPSASSSLRASLSKKTALSIEAELPLPTTFDETEADGPAPNSPLNMLTTPPLVIASDISADLDGSTLSTVAASVETTPSLPISTPVLPILPTTTQEILAMSTAAQSNARSLQARLNNEVYPAIDQLVHGGKSATHDAMNALNNVRPLAEQLVGKLGGNTASLPPCSLSQRRDILGSLLKSAVSVLSCMDQIADDITRKVGLDSIKSSLDNLQNFGNSLAEASDDVTDDASRSWTTFYTSSIEALSTRSLSSITPLLSFSTPSWSPTSTCTQTTATQEYVSCLTATATGLGFTSVCITHISTVSGCDVAAFTTTTVPILNVAGFITDPCGPQYCSECANTRPLTSTQTCSDCEGTADVVALSTGTLTSATSASFAATAVPSQTLDTSVSSPSPVPAIRRRTLKGPADFETGADGFMVTYFKDPQTILVPNSDLGAADMLVPSTSTFVSFGSLRQDVGQEGLRGCTTVVVVSQGGVWMSHFWETSMIDIFPIGWDEAGNLRYNHKINEVKFSNDILSIIGPGQINNNKFEALNSHIGPGQAFAPGMNTEVHIVAPRGRKNPDDYEHPYVNSLLSLEFQNLLASGGVQVTPELHMYTIRDQELLEETAFGKVLVQYDPFQEHDLDAESGCLVAKATWRFWTESEMPSQDIWPARFAKDPNSNQLKRADTVIDTADGYDALICAYQAESTTMQGNSSTFPSIVQISSVLTSSSSTYFSAGVLSTATAARGSNDSRTPINPTSMPFAPTTSLPAPITSLFAINNTTLKNASITASLSSSTASISTVASSTEAIDATLSCLPDSPVFKPYSTIPIPLPPLGVTRGAIDAFISNTTNSSSLEPDIGCDGKMHNGQFLSSGCGEPIYSALISSQNDSHYELVLGVKISGNNTSSSATITSSLWSNRLYTILKTCVPFEQDGEMLSIKYGGVYNETLDGAQLLWFISFVYLT